MITTSVTMYQQRRSELGISKNEIFLIGEQLRMQMLAQNIVASRRHHFRIYTSCFIGCDVVDWLIQTKHVSTRDEAISSMRLLQDHLVIHHVCNKHVFKDENLFYRFRRDDDSYMRYNDIKYFYKALYLSQRMRCQKDILKDIHLNGQLFKSAFWGFEIVDWLVQNHEVCSREDAVRYCRRLMDINIIKHVSSEFRFRDDHLLYQFTIDFTAPYFLCDISRLSHISSHTNLATDRVISQTSASDDNLCRSYNAELKDDNCTSEQTQDTSIQQPQSVLLRHVTAEELEDPQTPYVKHAVRVVCDSVGYGFVIRGEGPVYIQIVDPDGPAAAAGLKVRQYLHSVNGVNVLRKNHRTAAKMIFQNPGFVNLVILTNKRDMFS